MTLTLRISLAVLAALAAIRADAAEEWSLAGGVIQAAPPIQAPPEAAEPCDLCAEEWCPLWTVRAGTVYLHRSQPESPLGLLAITNSGEVPDFQWAPGSGCFRHPRYGMRRQPGSAVFSGPTTSRSMTRLTLGQVLLASQYDSRIHSTEINFRRQATGRITWLAGFRWIELHEQLDLAQDVGIFVLSESVNVDNHMYGGQVGADIDLLCGCGPWSLDAVLKAGVFADVADADRSIAINGGTIFADRIDDTEAAFVGEIGITAAYDLNDCWALVGGYQLLWVNGAALASEQIEPEINLSGDIFYHGALVGLERTW